MKVLEALFNIVLFIAGGFILFMVGWCIRGYKETEPITDSPVNKIANSKTLSKIEGQVLAKHAEWCSKAKSAPVMTVPVAPEVEKTEVKI